MIWVTILKTTVELSDELMRSAKAHATEQNITFRALVERGLRLAMRADQSKAKFVLRDASVNGDGLNPELKGKDWGAIRSLIYEGKGS